MMTKKKNLTPQQIAKRKAKNKAKRKQKKKMAVRPSNIVPRLTKRVANIQDSNVVKMIASSIALPYECGIRIPTSEGIMSSVMRSMDNFSLTAPPISSQSNPPGFDVGDVLFHHIGQPACLGYVWMGSDGLAYSSYDCVFNVETTSETIPVNAWKLCSAGGASPIPTAQSDWPLINCVHTGTGIACHGKTMAIAEGAGQRYLYGDYGGGFYIFTEAPTAGSTGSLAVRYDLYLWSKVEDAEGLLKDTKVAYLNNAGSWSNSFEFLFDEPGYYRVRLNTCFVTGDVTSSSVFAQIALRTPIGYRYGQISMADMDPLRNGDPNVGRECRLTGSALLVTNTSPVINRGGTILAGRHRGRPFYDFSKTDLESLAEKYNGDAAVGIYTFREWNEKMERFQTASIRPTNTSAQSLTFSLDVLDWVHTIQLKAPANNFNVVFYNCLEFISDAARFSKSQANGKIEDMHIARKHINSVPEWFYENPTHAQKLYALIRGAGRFINQNGPAMLRGANYAFPNNAAITTLMRLLNLR